ALHVRVCDSPAVAHDFASTSPGAHAPSPLHVEPFTQMHASGSHVSMRVPHFPQTCGLVSPGLHSAPAFSPVHVVQSLHVAPLLQVRVCFPHLPHACDVENPGVHSPPIPVSVAG